MDNHSNIFPLGILKCALRILSRILEAFIPFEIISAQNQHPTKANSYQVTQEVALIISAIIACVKSEYIFLSSFFISYLLIKYFLDIKFIFRSKSIPLYIYLLFRATLYYCFPFLVCKHHVLFNIILGFVNALYFNGYISNYSVHELLSYTNIFIISLMLTQHFANNGIQFIERICGHSSLRYIPYFLLSHIIITFVSFLLSKVIKYFINKNEENSIFATASLFPKLTKKKNTIQPTEINICFDNGTVNVITARKKRTVG